MLSKYLILIFVSTFVFDKTRASCGDYCHDCKDKICYSCRFAIWDNTKKKCLPYQSSSSKVPQIVKTTYEQVKHCMIRGRDNKCLQCEDNTISILELVNEELELRCVELNSAEGKKLIGDVELKTNFKSNCIFIVPRKNNAKVTVQDKLTKLIGLRCLICKSGVPNSNQDDCISVPENSKKKIS